MYHMCCVNGYRGIFWYTAEVIVYLLYLWMHTNTVSFIFCNSVFWCLLNQLNLWYRYCSNELCKVMSIVIVHYVINLHHYRFYKAIWHLTNVPTKTISSKLHFRSHIYRQKKYDSFRILVKNEWHLLLWNRIRRYIKSEYAVFTWHLE